MATVQSTQIILNGQCLPYEDLKLDQVSPAPVLQLADLSHQVVPKEKWKPPPSIWTSQCHRRLGEVASEVDDYFLKNWKFLSPKSERTFLNAGFSKVTCLYFPTAKDDRIQCACRLLTVLFLIDDMLDDMSLAEGKAFNDKLILIIRGHVQPDHSIAAERILYDLWKDMRALNELLANAVLEPTFVFMQAQTDKARLSMTELGPYFAYREKDVGKALLSALMRFTLDLHLSPTEIKSMEILEGYCARHISIVNDIQSWEKEVKASQSGHREGSVLCSAVKILADETGLGIEAAKRVLWSITREWEHLFNGIVAERLAAPQDCSQKIKDYMQGLEHQMSGNETWSLTTLRYSDLK